MSYSNEKETVLEQKPRGLRKSLGIYYTPDELTKLITAWAVRSQNEKILEPSFGGCGFVNAILQRLRSLGANDPASKIFGCDIDPDSFKFLKNITGTRKSSKNFLLADFLTLDRTSWPTSGFEVVIGNPPYVSHHNMDFNQKKCAREINVGIMVPGTSSLWVYFVLHSMSFLQAGGRLAFILPEAFLTSYYAERVRTHIVEHFRSTLVIKKSFRLFEGEGTNEKTLIVLADDYRPAKMRGEFNIINAYSIQDVDRCISWTNKRYRKNGRLYQVLNGQKSMLPKEYEHNIIDNYAIEARSILGVKIGLVTGANKYFIIDESTVREWCLPRNYLFPIIGRTAAARGLEFSENDHRLCIKRGDRGWLFCPDNLGPRDGPVRRYLASVPRNVRRGTLWFKKRKRWYAPEGYKKPDAFLTYMNHGAPRVVLNLAGVDCTNTLHRITFEESLQSVERKLIAISLQTTFSQISAERVGRAYGGGVLKLEPSEFGRMQLMFPKVRDPKRIANVFGVIDSHLRCNDLEAARSEADNFILGMVLKEKEFSNALKELNATLTALRRQRWGKRPLR